MELTYEEELQLDNSKEHLQTVLVNIRMANEELEEVLGEVEDARIELATQEAIRDKIKEGNLVEIKKRIATEQYSLTISKKIKLLLLIEGNLKSSITEAEDKISLLNNRISELNSIYEKSIRDKARKVAEYTNEIKVNRRKITEHEEKNHQQLRVKQSIENEIAELYSVLEEAKKGLMKFLFKAQKIMEETQKLIEEEKSKIQNPLDLIRRETEKLEILKSDLATIKARLTQQFKDQNPEKNLPIELQ